MSSNKLCFKIIKIMLSHTFKCLYLYLKCWPVVQYFLTAILLKEKWNFQQSFLNKAKSCMHIKEFDGQLFPCGIKKLFCWLPLSVAFHKNAYFKLTFNYTLCVNVFTL